MGMLDGSADTLTRVKGTWGPVLYSTPNTGPWAAPENRGAVSSQ